MYFSFLLFILASCIPILWSFIYIHCTLFSYIWWWWWWWCMFFFTYLYMCCFLSLFIHMFLMYAIFISVSQMMLWWVFFKCFRNTGCESLSCHELSSCKVFQEFVVWIDLFCNTTSGYELSNLRLLSWLVVLLWFCHGLPKGEIVKGIFYVIS